MTYEDLSKEILLELSSDGRQSHRELADKLDVSAATIGNRISKLRDDGILRGVRADIDYEKLGYKSVAVTRFKVPGDSITSALDKLEEYDRLTDIYEVTGNYDILAIGHYRDRQQMNRVIKELQGDETVLETNTSMVLNIVRENSPLALDDVEF
jgi:DNA-binding Lrp family transcriptional regulator